MSSRKKEEPQKSVYLIKKEAREKNGRSRVYFDLSKRAQDLLKVTSAEQHVPQVSLIELMIRRYCEPNKEMKKSEF